MNYYDQNTHKDYYQGNNLGHYQFVSLDDIIANFQVSYVGEDKIIPKCRRSDVAFHAQRALQELTYDTIRSCKSQQVNVCSSLKMPLPHDYVNYTKITKVDTSGIEHILYPTRHTSNPFQIRQDANCDYTFIEGQEILVNSDFSDTFGLPWVSSNIHPIAGTVPQTGLNLATGYNQINPTTEAYEFYHESYYGFGINLPNVWSRSHAIWQPINVTGVDYISISATGTSGSGTLTDPDGILRFGISSTPGDVETKNFGPLTPTIQAAQSLNSSASIFDLATDNGTPSYIEWTNGASNTQELLLINVQNYTTVYALVTSSIETYTTAAVAVVTNIIDDLSVTNSEASQNLTSPLGNEINSSTWNNYSSSTPSEISNDTYEDNVYWPYEGERYGLEPEHAQVNGSFYIDCKSGMIHFSSNLSGQDIILHYLSDSRGTDKEMQVHKFAEEAMYKWIAYGILSSRLNVPEYLVRRFKKEKFAETRKAKLRLSNIKLEEITQVLRGKSKFIKH